MAVQGVTPNKPVGKHVAAPPPLKPGSQMTFTTCPVEPTMEPANAWSELGTWLAVQALAVQGVTAENTPPCWHVATPPPVYPALQVTVTVCPTPPAMEPAAAWSELATCVLVQGLPVQGATLNKPLGWHVAKPPPLNAALQVTNTMDPVVPTMEPAAA